MVDLLTLEGEFRTGRVVDRPNRFVVRVRFDGGPERAYLADPGALEGVVEPGVEILCTAADDPDRATDYDAIATRVDDRWVSVRASLANDLFERALAADALPRFAEYRVRDREPTLPDHGRTDFLLASPADEPAYLEVKSCNHVDDGIAKFPDRQTERGRRHLRSLASLRADGHETHVVFVIQRPDVDRFRPYRTVDPDFASLLERVHQDGVEVHAMATAFDPPTYRLAAAEIRVDLD